jgi:Rod binding domain-containing protein
MDLKVVEGLKHFNSTPEINQGAGAKNDARLKKAAKEFESLFTGMILKSMTKNTDGLFGDNSFGGDYYESIFENAIASKISEGKGIGIADFIYKKLENRVNPGSENSNSEKAQPAHGVKEKIDLRNTDKDFFSTPPSQSSLKRLDQYESAIQGASELYGVDQNLIKSVILAESAANEKAVSASKAKGLMQLMDQTAKDMGVQNVWNPKENIYGGTKYLSEMLRLYNGDVSLALASYNAGPGNVEKYDGVPPFDETKNYITRVLGYLNHFNS